MDFMLGCTEIPMWKLGLLLVAPGEGRCFIPSLCCKEMIINDSPGSWQPGCAVMGALFCSSLSSREDCIWVLVEDPWGSCLELPFPISRC